MSNDNVVYLGGAPAQDSVADRTVEVLAYIERALEYVRENPGVTDCCVFLGGADAVVRIGTMRLNPGLVLSMGAMVAAWHDRLNATSSPA